MPPPGRGRDPGRQRRPECVAQQSGVLDRGEMLRPGQAHGDDPAGPVELLELRLEVETLAAARGELLAGQRSEAAQGVGDDPLQLPVDRAELVGRPPFERLHGRGVDTKHETLVIVLFSHRQLNQ